MAECKKNRIPYSMGIDTWGCDFVLLDENDKVLGNSVSYRDSRTDGIPEKVNRIIYYEDLYKKTGDFQLHFDPADKATHNFLNSLFLI